MNTQHGNVTHRYKPNGHLNFHTGRFDIYLSAWSNFDRDRIISDERTDYTAQNSQLTAHSELSERKLEDWAETNTAVSMKSHRATASETEFEDIGICTQTTPNDSYTDFQSEAELTHTQSRYEQLTIHETMRRPSTTSGRSTRWARRSSSWPTTTSATPTRTTTTAPASRRPTGRSTRSTATVRRHATMC